MDIAVALEQGRQLCQRANWIEADRLYSQLISQHPYVPEIYNEFASCLYRQQRYQEAVARYQAALQLRPNMVEVLSNLGSALLQLRQFDDAIRHLQTAIQYQPQKPELHNNLGNVFHAQARHQEAAQCFQQALKLKSDYPEAWINLGNALTGLGLYDAAIKIYRTALQLVPESVDARFNLANVFRRQGKLGEAVDQFEDVLRRQPQYTNAWQNLGVVRKLQGRLADALQCFQKAVELQPGNAVREANLLFTQHFLPGTHETPGLSNAELLERHRNWSEKYAERLTAAASNIETGSITSITSKASSVPTARSVMRSSSRLRIGFVSPDLHNHPVSLFLIRTLEALPRDDFEVVCYSDCVAVDEFTARFKTRSDLWHETYGWSDDALAQRISRDKIDILFDLAGHTKGSRLLVFARRPAPIQCTYIGYPGTTGLSAINYLLTDRWHFPVSTKARDDITTEQIYRLPHAPFCYEPPQLEAAIGALPAIEKGYVTFGSFNNPAKINEVVIETWANVLNAVPNSKLILKYRGLDDRSSAEWFSTAFESHGVRRDRIELQGFAPFEAMLREYQRIDIALDPFPFTGGLTSLLSLWMGLPVLTLPGESFASRQSMSYLRHLEFDNSIASSRDDYVKRAVEMAHNLEKLAQWRCELRGQLLTSPLCNAKEFAADFAQALHTMAAVGK